MVETAVFCGVVHQLLHSFGRAASKGEKTTAGHGSGRFSFCERETGRPWLSHEEKPIFSLKKFVLQR